MLNLELVYAKSTHEVICLYYTLPEGATVKEALIELWLKHPETKELPVGIFAKRVGLEHKLRDGDRIEVYRPLSLNPKERRRKKAKNSKGSRS